MSSCLGLYIESDLIKYAKVTKEHEMLKIEAFGIKFYDKLGEAIKQIISETYSFKTPISVNLSDEMYNYFYMFNLLNKNDLKKAIETEFESQCFEKNVNKNAFTTRYALSNSMEDKDKIKVIHVSTNKTTIAKQMQQFENATLSTITPIGTSITNVTTIKPKENIVIVNIEDKTTITTVVNQEIYNVEKIDVGAKEILDKINEKENSYSKAYEICKNSTIYTMEGKELQDEENEYLDDIMPSLYKIVTKVQEYLAESTIKVSHIYITGTMSVVNNIDLYFQEFFTTEKCEVLKPYFVTENVKINIKDYIEVNSAIALALQGLDYGIKNMNFKNPSLSDRIPDWMKIEIGPKTEKEPKKETNSKKKKFNINMKLDFSDLKTKLDHTEKWMLRGAGGILILSIIYASFSIYLDNEISKKILAVEDVKSDTQKQISLVEKDISDIKAKTSQYVELRENLEKINSELEENLRYKDAVPNLLVKIMSIIPEGVQLTEIQNTTGTHIVIKAQSKQYEQLGYFKAKLKQDNVLLDVISTQGEKQDEFVKVVIEGDLP